MPRRPGLFAEQWFRFPPGKWPGGAGCDASPIQIWLGFIRYMWSYKTHIDGGPFMCYRLILYQAFIQTYPTMGSYYLALAYNQAAGQARTRILGGHAAACAADARQPRAPAATDRSQRTRTREHVV